MSLLPLLLTALFLVAAIVISGIVSALETALFCLKEADTVTVSRHRPELSGILGAIARQPLRSLHQALILGTVFNLVVAVAALLLYFEWSALLTGGRARVILAATIFGTVSVFSELIPTLIAIADPGRVFQATVKPFILISPALEKLSGRLEAVTNALVRLILPTQFTPRIGMSDDELETLIEMRRDEGSLAESESEIIQDIVRLGNKTVKDCMTPRVDATMLSSSLSDDEALEALRTRAAWHWRIPVFDQTPDVVVGVLDVKRWLSNPRKDFRDSVLPPVFLPETMKALDAFRDFLAKPGSLGV
ncbi:MAG: DUF21 domain-containing protein, partial [Verrucomicrobiae bacterium]|nr:DUF21 domain-containing protein [Verrucomicrobiae bacterium]